MQSGITASADLHTVFNAFTSDPSLFALPITIANESLQPLEAIPFTSSSFTFSLPSLTKHLQPKTPIYLVLRRSPDQKNDLVAVTYVPSVAPVRSKTLFASTRSSLVRDLGLEKFTDTIFVTDAEEVLDPKQWEGNAAATSAVDMGILSTEERELQGVKRAEEEERHGTAGRDLMGKGGSGSRLAMATKVTPDARSALQGGILNEDARLVQIGIDMSTEELELLSSESGVSPAEVQGRIPDARPTYTFYHYPQTPEVIFMYTCPGTSKVKERMVYASSKMGVLEVAKDAGVGVTKRLEAGSPEEWTEDRLADEVGIKKSTTESAGGRQGFSKPKRPGRR